MKKRETEMPRTLLQAMVLSWLIGCGSSIPMEPLPVDEGQDLAVASVPIPESIRLRLITHNPSENGSELVAILPQLNTVYAPAGIQFVFSGAADVQYVAPTPVGPGDRPDKACESSLPLADAVRGALPLVLCPEQGGGNSGGDLNYARIGWLIMGHVAHELGHYFGLSHIFRGYYRPFDADLPTAPAADCGANQTEPDGSISRWYSTECRVRQDVTAAWNAVRQSRCCSGQACNSTCMNTIPSDILDSGLARLLYWADGDGIADTGPAWHDHGSLPVACSGAVSLTYHFGSQTRTYTVTPDWTNAVSYYPCANTPLPTISAQQAAIIRQVLFSQANRTHLLRQPLTLRETRMSDAAGFTQPSSYATLRFPDINGDGKADACARANSGVICEVSNGSAFTSLLTQTSFSDANGWGQPEYYSTIAFPDVNGDGKADVCGRGGGGVWCALSSGAALGSATLWASAFSDANGWNGAPYYTTLQFPDVNRDGRSDLCGRGYAGIYCALSTGSSFGVPTLWTTFASDAAGWGSGPQYYKTLSFPDVNSDGFADVCGRGSAGVSCALSTGSSFSNLALWQSDVSDLHGWNSGPEYYETLRYADVNADGKIDLCARGGAGILCGLSTGSSFAAPTLWTTWFRDADGGNQPQYYRTITVIDLNRDGRADFCGRGIDGVFCMRSSGAAFVQPYLLTYSLSDVDGWSGAPYYSTIRFADVDGDGAPEVCGRGGAGVYCSQ